MPTPNASGAQSGAVTHHHDQVIALHNLRIKNTINSIPQNPILPPDPSAITLNL